MDVSTQAQGGPLASHAVTPDARLSLLATLTFVSQNAATLVVLVGCLVLVGWVFDVTLLKSVAPGFVAMNPLTAVCFVAAGLSLLLASVQPDRGPRRLGQLCALSVSLIGGMKFGGILIGWDSGLDQLLFHEKLANAAGLFPNQMAPNTALNFLLIGCGLLLLHGGRPFGAHLVTGLTGLISLIAALGYLYDIHSLYRVPTFIPMALHTAVAFVVLSVGLLLARSGEGLMAVVTNDSPGGVLARRLLPAAIGMPVVLGLLRLWGQEAGYYGMGIGISIMVVGSICIFTVLILLSAAQLWSLDMERKRNAERIERDRNQYQALMDSSNDGLAMADLNSNIIFMNATFAKTWGIEHRHEYFGKPVAEARAIALAKVKDPEPYLKFMEKVWGDPEASEEVLVEFHDGTALRLRSSPVRDSDGQIVGRNLNFADQTRERAIDRMKSEFVATVSHELRTPLTSLLGFSELLLNRDVTAQKRQVFLETMHRETKRLTNLVNDFLDLQKIESGGTAYDLRPVDLKTVVRAVEKVFAGQLGQQRLTIRFSENLPQVRADRDRVQQVLVNLLSNAIKYSPHGGDIVVSARKRDDTEMVEVSVQDHGLGIPAEAIPKLFEKFYRVDSTDRRKISGTGLGLALCREIISAQGGDITVTSREGEGSTFMFTLPIAHTRPAGYQISKAASDSNPDASYILIVEDELGFVQLVQEHLLDLGFQCKVSPSAEEAIEIIKQHSPLLILLDIHLAGKTDGWDLLLKIKQDPATWNVPVIIISVTEKKSKGLALGLWDYLIKPFPMDRLLDGIQRAVGMGRGQMILLADDDGALRGTMAEALRKAGYKVLEAQDGAGALSCLESDLPELLILDLIMPNVDGFEVLSRLRKVKNTLKLPVIVITGASLSVTERDFVKRRMAGLLPKSEYTPQRLSEMLQKVLQEARPITPGNGLA